MDFAREKERITASYARGEADLDFSRVYTRTLDEYLTALMEKALAAQNLGEGLALVAMGGYGRERMSPYSDVDLLFLHDEKVNEGQLAKVIEAIVYPLWDHKLEVGQATRTIAECERLGQKDFVTLVATLESRFLAGDEMLFTQLKQNLRYQYGSRKQRRAFLASLKGMLEERHAKFGSTPYLLEPNIKEGHGGLRDIQAIHWLGQGLYLSPSLTVLVKAGYLPPGGDQALEKAYEFMTRARTRLHALAGAKADTLTFALQEGLAAALGYGQASDPASAERFMREYYTHVYVVKRNLAYALYQAEEDFIRPVLRKMRRGYRTVERGLIVRRGMVELVSASELAKRPALMMRAFDTAMNEELEISPRALDLIQRHLGLVDETFRWSPEVSRYFFRALLAPAPKKAGAPLNMEAMLDANLLAAYIPELAPTRARVQHDAYHVYTLDLHLILTLWRLKVMAAGRGEGEEEKFESWVMAQVEDKRVLFLAGLIHDVGKPLGGGDHSSAGARLAPVIGARLGLEASGIEDLAFLVRHHLTLINTATRRDLGEEKPIIRLSREVGDVNRLAMLYLLTTADSKATGPQAWNAWRAALMRELFTKIYNVLTRSDLGRRENAERIQQLAAEVKRLLKGRMDPAEVDRLLEDVSEQYLSAMDASQVARHLLLEKRLTADELVVWDVRKNGGPCHEATVVTKTKKTGLLAALSGVFALNNINILGAQVFTRGRGVAMDVFQIEPPPGALYLEELWAKVEADIRRVLSGELILVDSLMAKKPLLGAPKTARQRPIKVVVDNEASDFHTIVEVHAPDRLGLLYDLTKIISSLGLSIHLAKIATAVDKVVDVFYVRDLDGQKVDDPGEVKRIIELITKISSQ